MLNYIMRRLGLFISTAFILTLIAYALHYWLNQSHSQPIINGYITYMIQILKGNWGISIIDHQPILAKGLKSLASTLELSIFAFIGALTLAIPLGIIAGIYRNGQIDYLIMSTAIIALALPVFWVAIMMPTVSNIFHLTLPIDGQISPIYEVKNVTGFMLIDSLFTTGTYHFEAFYSRVRHLILPSIVLSLFIFAETIRLTRHSISMVMKSNYINAAYSKGLSTVQILRSHVFKNIYPSIIHDLRSNLSTLFSFAMTVDIVFKSKGSGQWLLTSIHEGDYIVLPTAILIIGGFILLSSILIDILLMLTSPTKRITLYVD
ncbi:MAG: ABC transporter permease subunit [Psychromonas sp.]|nr:ABC transporter permease subunit [Psychromonas sp.]